MHPTKKLPDPAFTLLQRIHSLAKDGADMFRCASFSRFQVASAVVDIFLQGLLVIFFGFSANVPLSSNEGRTGLWSVVFAWGWTNSGVLVVCARYKLSRSFYTRQCMHDSSRYRAAEWPAALMILLSDSYLGKHWRTLGNCFYDSGSPLWADPSGKQQSSQRARTCKSFQTWPFPFSPTVHKISSEKFKKVHKA